MQIDMLTATGRIIVTFVMSLTFGVWRQRSRKPVGFGTFIFVAVGSCSLAITAINLSENNPLPLLGAIVTGIGFLGAGALIKTTDKIFGFTSAATIWIFAIFGLIIGVGEYIIGALVYILLIVVLVYDVYLEERGAGSHRRKLVINTKPIINEKEIRDILRMNTSKFRVNLIEIDKKNDKLSITYLIEGTKEQINKIPRKLYEKEWFESCKAE